MTGSNRNMYLIILVSLLLIGISLFGMCTNIKKDKHDRESQNDLIFSCSTISKKINFEQSDSINLNIGKLIFRNNCATCHAKDMRTNATGPALHGVIRRFDKDTMKIAQYILDHGSYLETIKNENIQKTDHKYGSISILKNANFSKNEIISLIEYIGH